MFKSMGMLPNISNLTRTFKKDRHTIKKMYEGKEKKERKSHQSGCGHFYLEINKYQITYII